MNYQNLNSDVSFIYSLEEHTSKEIVKEVVKRYFLKIQNNDSPWDGVLSAIVSLKDEIPKELYLQILKMYKKQIANEIFSCLEKNQASKTILIDGKDDDLLKPIYRIINT
jgi:hypothetical protein